MKNYDLITRELSWYRLALSYFEEYTDFGNGFDGVCKALYQSSVDLKWFRQNEYVKNEELMPSLHSLRTTSGGNAWWFLTREERMEALRKAIELCIKKRELIWLRMVWESFDPLEGVCTTLYCLGVDFAHYFVRFDHNKVLLPTLYSVRTRDTMYWFNTGEERIEGVRKAIAILEEEVGGGVLPKQ